MTSRNGFRLTPARLAFAGVGLLVAAGVGALHSQPLPVPPVRVGGTLQVANDLDAIIQPRFQDDAGAVFGMGRVSPAVQGHSGVGIQGSLQTHTVAETALRQRADAAGRDYIVAFLHFAHAPGQRIDRRVGLAGRDALLGTFDSPRHPVDPLAFRVNSAPYLTTLVVKRGGVGASQPLALGAVLQKPALSVLPAVRRGNAMQVTSDPWVVFVRPVLASQASCLGCHTGARTHQTLGAMVYAVSNKVNPVPVASAAKTGSEF